MNLLVDARRNLATHFRSVHVSTGVDQGPERIGPPAHVLARWLEEYHAAYVEANEAEHGGRLHLLRGRMLTLVGDHLLTTATDVATLAEAALRCGMSTTLAVSITAMAAHAHALVALREAMPGLQYRIDCTGVGVHASEQALAACRATLAAHVLAGGNVSLIGDVGPLRATGILADDLFNQTFVSITPVPEHETRHMNRAHAFAPCRDFIAWYVDAAGDLYPCAGLLGHAPARFGSVHEPFTRLVDALAYSEVGIDALARRGPRLPEEPARFPADLCALHRRVVHGIATL
jgi:hypothetical protein